MARVEVTLQLDEQDGAALAALAADEGVAIAALLQRVVAEYLARRVVSAELATRWERLIAHRLGATPSALTPGQVEADIDVAIAEARQARRAARGA